MHWIKASEHYPFLDWHIARKVGTTKRMPLMFTTNVIAGIDGKTYSKEEIEWLDYREPDLNNKVMSSDFIVIGQLNIQTLKYKGVEYIKLTDIIQWLKIHGETGVIPHDVSHQLLDTLVRMKNKKYE